MRSWASLVAVVVPLAATFSACGDGKSRENASPTTTSAVTGAPRTISVLGSRSNDGPFARSLSLKLVDGLRPIPFYVCAAWGEQRAPHGCGAASGARLPLGTTLHLEQHPAGPAAPTPDPGWGTVGTSDSPELNVPLSNGVTGNKLGTVTFRATLRRNASGAVVATSDTFTLVWHR